MAEDEVANFCVDCVSPVPRQRDLELEIEDVSPSFLSPGRMLGFTDSNFARALQRRELAACNPTYDSDRSLALLINVNEHDELLKPEAGDNIVRALFACGMCGAFGDANATFAVDACAHQLCVGCVRSHVALGLQRLDGSSDVGCPVVGCAASLTVVEIRRIAGPGAYDRFIERRLQHHLDAAPSGDDCFVRCPTCSVASSVARPETLRGGVERLVGEAPTLDHNGQPLAAAYRLHFVSHRYRCGACGSDFCGGCVDAPYHLGYTCEEWAEAKRAPHCRFCEAVLPAECACAESPPPVLMPPPHGGGGKLALARPGAAALSRRNLPFARRLLGRENAPGDGELAVAPAHEPLKRAAFAAAAKRLIPQGVWQRMAHVQHPHRPQHHLPPQQPPLQPVGNHGRAGERMPGDAAPAAGVPAAGVAEPGGAPAPHASALVCRRVSGAGRAWQTCCARECTERGAGACLRVRECGHPCLGLRGEAEDDCLGCLRSECLDAARAPAERASDLCNICWAEPLSAAPSLRLGCGHVFHSHCVRERLRQRWAGRAVSYEFIHCPLCKAAVSHASLDLLIAPHVESERILRARALERLHYEGLVAAREVADEGAAYFNRPVAFALSRYDYYECDKCKLPYFGGLAACGEQPEGGFNPEEQVCGGCSAAHGAANTRCAVHGSDHIEYKCRFCCEVASWYCWGTTHFCSTCHLTASTVQPKPCTCGRDHPPNGREHAFGCALCHATRTF